MSDFSSRPPEEPVGIQKTLGFVVTAWEDGRCVMELEADERHMNRSGVLHGGVLATLLDQTMSLPGLFCPVPGRVRRSVTLSLTTAFTGQCTGGRVRAVGTLKASGGRIYSSQGEVFGPDGTLLAVGQGTFRRRSGSEKPEGVPADEIPRKPD